MTIACFKPTISMGSTLTHVRFITWTTQCTCWLVVRRCEKYESRFLCSKVVNRLASQCLGNQSPPLATCEESKEEHSMKERLETPVGNEGSCFVLEQLEGARIVEDLGDAEPPWEHRVEENPSKKIEFDAKEECAQPPKDIPYEELDGIEQELSSDGIFS